MPEWLEQAVQISGSLLILVPFALVQARRMTTDSVTYLVLNIVGSTILAVDAAFGRQYGFLLLETVWALVSVWGLFRVTQGRPPAASH